MRVLALIAAGGALGAIARDLAAALGEAAGLEAWAATMGVNLLGSFAMGVLFTLLEARGASRRLVRTALGARLSARGFRPDDDTAPLELRALARRARLLSAFLLTGVLGGFTTYSTFALQMVELARSGRAVALALGLAISVGGGLLAVLWGVRAAEHLLGELRPGRGPAREL